MNDRELLLHQVAAKFISGEDLSLSLEGKSAEIDALHDLLIVSKKLKESLDNNDSIENISFLLEDKKLKTKKFEELSNITWRL
jgi:hypothetical protein